MDDEDWSDEDFSEPEEPTEEPTEAVEEAAPEINLNSSTKEELMKIPGINETMADAIVKYREKNGPFENYDDLDKVKNLKREQIKTIKKWAVL